jgi:hypothetical protein
VVTKTDLYPQWRRIVELNREHLRRAGLDMPVVPVSSFLRLRSRVDPDLEQESGFPALGEVLAEYVNSGGERAAAVAAEEVTFVADQIARTVELERSVVEQPAQAHAVVEDLTERRARAERLVSSAATWQQMLSDGVQDLVSDVEHDLQQRLRTLVRDAEAIIEAGDPQETWADIEVWLQRQLVTAMVANQDLLADRADQLTAQVGESFDLDCDQHVMLPGVSQEQLFADVRLPGVESLSPAGGRFAQMLIAGRMASLVPMMIFGIGAQLIGGATIFLAPVSAVLAVGVGRKILKDDRSRQVSYRRQQAKAAVRRFIDEVAFVINKQARDSLRQTHRVLRDEFTARARSIQRSSEVALEVVHRAAAMEPAARQERADQLVAQDARLRALTQDAARLVVTGAGSGRG